MSEDQRGLEHEDKPAEMTEEEQRELFESLFGSDYTGSTPTTVLTFGKPGSN